MQVSDSLHTYKPNVWLRNGAENAEHGNFNTAAIIAHREVLREHREHGGIQSSNCHPTRLSTHRPRYITAN